MGGGEQMKKDRKGPDNAKSKGLDNAKRKGCEKDNKWKLRIFRARRDLSRAGYKVQDIIGRDHKMQGIKEKHCTAGNNEEGNGQTRYFENIFVTPLFGTKIVNILNDDGEKEDVEKIVKTVVSDLIEQVVEDVG